MKISLILLLAILIQNSLSIRFRHLQSLIKSHPVALPPPAQPSLIRQSVPPPQCADNYIDIESQKVPYLAIQNQASIWTDTNFPQSKALAGMTEVFVNAFNFGTPFSIFGSEGPQPSDISQGNLGDCYFLASIQSLASQPKYIYDLFLTDQNKAGISAIKFIVGGKPTVVSVDANFPSFPNAKQWTFQQESRYNVYWAMILEKSFAKLAGGYLNIQGGMPQQALRLLTGAPTQTKQHSDTSQSDIFNMMEDAQNNNFIMATGTSTAAAACGIVQNHSYSPLQVIRNITASNGMTYNLIEIRNPWAKNQWAGNFSKSSNLWTPQQKIKYKVDQKIGQFFMDFSDYHKCFEFTTVVGVRENYRVSYKEFANATSASQSFNKTVSENFSVMVELIPYRLLVGEGCATPVQSLTFSLYKIGSNNQKTLIQTSSQLGPITYTGTAHTTYQVDVSVKWKNSYMSQNEFNIVVYSSESLIFEEPKQQSNVQPSPSPSTPSSPSQSCTKKVDMTLPNGQPFTLLGFSWTTCSWFQHETSFCSFFGTSYPNQGLNAKTACVACGGGKCP